MPDVIGISQKFPQFQIHQDFPGFLILPQKFVSPFSGYGFGVTLCSADEFLVKEKKPFRIDDYSGNITRPPTYPESFGSGAFVNLPVFRLLRRFQQQRYDRVAVRVLQRFLCRAVLDVDEHQLQLTLVPDKGIKKKQLWKE